MALAGLPFDASLHGHRIDETLRTSAMHAALLFAFALTVLVVAVARGRRRERALAPSRRMGALALAAGGLAALALDAPLLLRSVRDVRDVFWNFALPGADPATTRVEIHARQWAWEARLPGRDEVFGSPDDVVTLGDVRVPRGVPVQLQIAAGDVVHSFSVPAMRVMADAIPGRVTHAWFQAQHAGSFEITCRQFCGPGHGLMRGRLLVMEPRDHAAWLQRAEALATVQASRPDAVVNSGWPWMPSP